MCRPWALPLPAYPVSRLSHAHVVSRAGAAVVVSPSLVVEMFPIGGFSCVSDISNPSSAALRTRFQTQSVEGNGLAAHFGKKLYCLAAEPRETILRVSVMDGDTMVAYETVVLGALRKGYRSLQLREPSSGSRISCARCSCTSTSGRRHTCGPRQRRCGSTCPRSRRRISLSRHSSPRGEQLTSQTSYIEELEEQLGSKLIRDEPSSEGARSGSLVGAHEPTMSTPFKA